MAIYYIKYANKELTAIDITGNNQNFIEHNNIEYLFKLMSRNSIKNISIEGNTLIINYGNDKVIIDDYVKILKDKKYKLFRSYLEEFVNNDNINNLLRAREQIKNNLRNNNHKILKRISITGIVVGFFVIVASATNNYFDYLQPTSNDNQDLALEENPEKRTNGYDYVIDNYKQIILKYSKKYGVPFEVVQAIIAHNIEQSSQYVGTDQFGALMNEFDEYLNKDIAVYDYENGNSYLYHITEDDLNGREDYIKTICIILQYKLTKVHYNIVAAIETLHRNDDEFQYLILKDAYERYPKYAEKPYFIKEYFKYAMQNTDDLSWLQIFDLNDGSYARTILKYIPNGTKLTIPHKNEEATYFTVNMNPNIKTKNNT